jgi:hypothetical protein
MLHYPGTSFPTACLPRSGLEKCLQKVRHPVKKLVPLSLIENITAKLKTFSDRFFLRIAEDRLPIDQNNAGLDFFEAAVGRNNVEPNLPFSGLVAFFLAGGSDDTPFVQHLFHVLHLDLSDELALETKSRVSHFI